MARKNNRQSQPQTNEIEQDPNMNEETENQQPEENEGAVETQGGIEISEEEVEEFANNLNSPETQQLVEEMMGEKGIDSSTESPLQPIEGVESPIEVEGVGEDNSGENTTTTYEDPEPIPELSAPEVEQPQVTEQPTIEVVELPVPKASGKKNAPKIVKKESILAPVSLATITLEEIVFHKHDFILGEASESLKDIIDFLDRYEERMSIGKHVDQAQGESLQKQMYKNYLRIFSLENPKERDVAMEVLLWKFWKDEKGAYRVTSMSRYTRNGRWIIKELNMYLQLNHIFNSVKNPQDRIVRLRQFSLAAIVDNFPADKARYTENFINWSVSIH